jgi:hypothetical protein
MNAGSPIVLRGLVGGILGSIVAAVAAGIAFVTFCSMPPDVPGQPNYYPYALFLVVMAAFLCGGVVGLVGFIARSASRVWWPVAGCYAFMLFLCVVKEASFHEGAPLIALASVGILFSVCLSLVTRRWLAKRGLNELG